MTQFPNMKPRLKLAFALLLPLAPLCFPCYVDDLEVGTRAYPLDRRLECACTSELCIRKCCAPNFVPENRTCVFRPATFQVSLFRNSQEASVPFSLTAGLMPCGHDIGYYMLEPDQNPDDRFLVQTDGSIWLPEAGASVEKDQYCVDTFQDGLSALVCFPKSARIAMKLNVLGMIISMPFLLATLLVYAVLPEKNLHGKCLMCYVFSLFGAYLFLVIISAHSSDIADFPCKLLATLCLFFFMVSFFWMNVMCADIWWTFSGLRGFSGSKKECERKRFLLYSGYAWGSPLLLVIIVLCVNLSKNVDGWFHPGIGGERCWFTGGLATFLYFYLPITILVVANVVLFVKTAIRLKQIQQDTAILRQDHNKRHNYEQDKQRFNLYLKLLLAMGVNWTMEVISWLVTWLVGSVLLPLWYLTDFCNALYGVFIFFVFVFKRSTWNLLKKRYYMIMGKLHLARTVTSSSSGNGTPGTSLTS